MIQYIKHQNINKTKWDECISNASNSMVYGLSWYLDIIAENWDAIILDDYQAVLPLPWKRKLGIKHIYHPYFAQQLGIFYQGHAQPKPSDFIKQIPKSFVKYELSFNYCNQFVEKDEYRRTNLVLPLNTNYTSLVKCFNTNTKRNIKKNLETDWLFNNEVTINNFLELKKDNLVNNLKNKHFDILQKLFDTLIKNQIAQIIGIEDNNGNLLSAAIFVSYKKRILYLFSASASSGKYNSCMFKIINMAIEKNADKDLIFDFEGSMIPGVARFFKGFGAQEEYYYRISKINL